MLYSSAVRAFLISFVLASACGGDAEVEQLEKVKGEVCSCKASKPSTDWLDQLQSRLNPMRYAGVKCAEAALDELPKTEIRAGHASQLLARQMLDCMSRLYEAERPTAVGRDGDGDGDSSASAP